MKKKKALFKVVTIDGVRSVFLGAAGAVAGNSHANNVRVVHRDPMFVEPEDSDTTRPNSGSHGHASGPVISAPASAPAAPPPSASGVQPFDVSHDNHDSDPSLELQAGGHVVVASAAAASAISSASAAPAQSQPVEEPEPVVIHHAAAHAPAVRMAEPASAEEEGFTPIVSEFNMSDYADDDDAEPEVLEPEPELVDEAEPIGVIETDADALEPEIAEVLMADEAEVVTPDTAESFEPIVTEFEMSDFPETPFEVDEEIPIASNVDDNMNFQDALNAAREEVGGDGVFCWNGNLFATFYDQQWENMSNDEKEAFVGHILWVDEDGIHYDFQDEPILANNEYQVDDIDMDVDAELADFEDVDFDDADPQPVEPEGFVDENGQGLAEYYAKEWDNLPDDEKEALAGHILYADEHGIHFDTEDLPVFQHDGLDAATPEFDLAENSDVDNNDISIISFGDDDNSIMGELISKDNG